MALYTGKGDKGTSKLFNTPKGKRVPKSDPVFEALGTFDELNTLIGWCKVATREEEIAIGKQEMAGLLHEVQDHLFTLQAELAGAEKSIPEESVADVERVIHEVEEELPEITTFLVPGVTELSARLDMARALSRRAERRLVITHESGREIGEPSLRYANRLSSLLYAFVRLVNHRAEADESVPRYR
ncbi:MAG: cob(I)yrinic acid a,c-diamide adenosyltransferase [Candidatus Paceibacteria bacterium]